ncbi:ATP-dependent DNA helicase PIF1-like protein [Tanacetum coccineum]
MRNIVELLDVTGVPSVILGTVIAIQEDEGWWYLGCRLCTRSRITLSDKHLPLKIIRKQYPLSVSFAMTINKSQGQLISKVGLYLTRHVFTHGQLYVALLKDKSKRGLKVVVCDDEGIRLRIILSDKRLPLKIVRKQYPLSVSFAMTINKSQGQSLSKVGLYLTRHVFTHGQLYVALSIVKSKRGLKVVVCDDDGNVSKTTTNIVYKEVFHGL